MELINFELDAISSTEPLDEIVQQRCLVQGLSQLNLTSFDISTNHVTHLPLEFHKLQTLDVFIVDNNPLLMPPSM